MKLIYIFLILSLVNCRTAKYQLVSDAPKFGFRHHHVNYPPDSIKTKMWISETSSKLKTMLNDTSVIISTPNIYNSNELKKVSYRVIGVKKIITKNGGFLILYPNSSHSNSEVGDITLAIDHLSNFYFNRGHICGNVMHFENLSLSVPYNVEEFILNFVSDTDSEKWIRL